MAWSQRCTVQSLPRHASAQTPPQSGSGTSSPRTQTIRVSYCRLAQFISSNLGCLASVSHNLLTLAFHLWFVWLNSIAGGPGWLGLCLLYDLGRNKHTLHCNQHTHCGLLGTGERRVPKVSSFCASSHISAHNVLPSYAPPLGIWISFLCV